MWKALENGINCVFGIRLFVEGRWERQRSTESCFVNFGHYKGRRQTLKDWEMSGVGVCDAKFLNNW